MRPKPTAGEITLENAPAKSSLAHEGRPEPSFGQAARGQIREVDGLRGCAILLVLLVHFWPRTGFLSAFTRIGYIGVDLFFVVSGFLIIGILVDTKGDPAFFKNFYARRFLRIFPLYYAALVVWFTLVPLTQAGPYFESRFIRTAGSPLWYLFYLSNIRNALVNDQAPPLINPVWSLAIEEQFYLLFPMVVALLSRRHLVRTLVFLVLFAPLFRTVCMLVWPVNAEIQYVATPSRLDLIALGGLAALTFRSRLVNERHATWAAAAGVTGFGVLFLLGMIDKNTAFYRSVGYSVVAVMFALVVMWAVSNRGTRATSILRFPPLCYLGTICYGVYVLQETSAYFVSQVVSKLHLPFSPDGLFIGLVKMGAAILSGTLSWYLFEKRVLRLKSRFSSRHHPTEVVRAGSGEPEGAPRDEKGLVRPDLA